MMLHESGFLFWDTLYKSHQVRSKHTFATVTKVRFHFFSGEGVGRSHLPTPLTPL